MRDIMRVQPACPPLQLLEGLRRKREVIEAVCSGTNRSPPLSACSNRSSPCAPNATIAIRPENDGLSARAAVGLVPRRAHRSKTRRFGQLCNREPKVMHTDREG